MDNLVSFDRLRLYTNLLCAALFALCVTPAQALDGGTLSVTTYNGWQAFEVISQGDDVPGDGFSYSMPGNFDGTGAWFPDGSTLRVQVNHETSDASISEVDLDLANLQTAIGNMIIAGNTGGVSFVSSARQAYGRWSSDGGSSFTSTSGASDTSFSQICSGQTYAADTFGQDRGFVDPVYITGEEVSGGRLFALDSASRDLYQLSGTIGSAPGGIGGMSFDSWENAALLDTGETAHVALLLSPDGGSSSLKLYIGEKGKDSNGNASNSFLARNGLAYGSWYYLSGSLPGSVSATNGGTFDTSSSGALSASKMEDIDTSPSEPTRVVLGNQNSGVFTLDFDLVFAGGFNAGASSFTVTKISNTSGGSNSLDSPDNVDWSAATILGGTPYTEGLIFVNEDNSSSEIWQLNPDGSNQVRIGQTTAGQESTGIFDLSEFVGYVPGSILITNSQGSPASMTVMINPDATSTSSSCGDNVCGIDENPLSCPQDCPDVCEDGLCTGAGPASWTYLSSANGDLPVPPENDGQSGLRVVDLDQDGQTDYILTLWYTTEPVVWYRQTAGTFQKYVIDTETTHLSHGERFRDIDGDGDIDLLFGDAGRGTSIYWWENPYPDYDTGTPWVRRTLYTVDEAFFHDNTWGDFDNDGADELIAWNQKRKRLLLFEVPSDPLNPEPWPVTEIFQWSGAGKTYKGADAIDINLDGKVDFLGGCGWYEHTGGTEFIRHTIDQSTAYSQIKAGQLIDGGRPEVVCLVELDSGPLNLYEWTGNTWQAHTLIPFVPSSHTLQLGDINQDGHLDIVVGELRRDNGRNLYALYGDGTGNFLQQVVASGEEHIEGQLADIDDDGDLDIVSQPFKLNAPKINMWINESSGPGVTVTVPGVVGLSQAEAEASLVAAGLAVGVVTNANSDSVPAGQVINQDPEEGTSVPGGSTVDLVISLGPVVPVTVPDVVGLSQAEAEASLVATGLTVGAMTTASSSTILAGYVISQEPAQGESVPEGSTVDLVISLGPVVPVTVPDVVGLSQAEAEASLVAAGLAVGVVTNTNSDSVPAGQVINQDPEEGTSVPGGSTVDLVLSSGTSAYQQDFETFGAGEDPADWFDTASDNRLSEDDGLFSVFDTGGERVFGTLSTATNIHSHYVGSALHQLSGYEFSGRMMKTRTRGGVGITVFSQYPSADVYYRLRQYRSNAFHLAPHGTTVNGDTDSGVIPDANQWYHFRILVTDFGGRTEIKARVWLEGTSEPNVWQIDAYDDSPTRVTGGTIGVWSMITGEKYWDDFVVR